VKRFRGGLVFKAHSWLYHSTLGSRVIKKKNLAHGADGVALGVARVRVRLLGVLAPGPLTHYTFLKKGDGGANTPISLHPPPTRSELCTPVSRMTISPETLQSFRGNLHLAHGDLGFSHTLKKGDGGANLAHGADGAPLGVARVRVRLLGVHQVRSSPQQATLQVLKERRRRCEHPHLLQPAWGKAPVFGAGG